VLRAEAEAAQTSAEHPEFNEQHQMCAARCTSARRSLLIFLQRATQQQFITPLQGK
jgi:hypothetical protein